MCQQYVPYQHLLCPQTYPPNNMVPMHPTPVNHPASRTTLWWSRGWCHQSEILESITEEISTVITSIHLRQRKKPKEKRGRRFDVKLLQDACIKADFANAIEECFEKRKECWRQVEGAEVDYHGGRWKTFAMEKEEAKEMDKGWNSANQSKPHSTG